MSFQPIFPLILGFSHRRYARGEEEMTITHAAPLLSLLMVAHFTAVTSWGVEGGGNCPEGGILYDGSVSHCYTAGQLYPDLSWCRICTCAGFVHFLLEFSTQHQPRGSTVAPRLWGDLLLLMRHLPVCGHAVCASPPR